jgi:hypothetical protein
MSGSSCEMPSEAQRTVELHRLTGMPVLVCRDAIRFGDGDRKRELEHLRRVVRDGIVAYYGSATAVTWEYPPALREQS